VAWGRNLDGQSTVPAGLIARVPNSAPWAAGITVPAGIVSGHRYTFAVGAGDPDGDALTYAWDMNSDGIPEQTSGVAGIYYAFPAGGTHTVRVAITDTRGVQVHRTATVAVEQNAAPVAAIQPISGAAEGAVLYPRAVVTDANLATDPLELKYVTYRWDFGDGTASTSATPSKRYDDSGTYPIRLTVTDRGGASRTTTAYVEVANLPPRATFMAPAGTTLGGGTSFLLFARSVTDPGPSDRASLEISFDCGRGFGYYGWERDLNATVSCIVVPGSTRLTVGMRVRDKDGTITEYKRNYTVQ
jgi:PKD repeat protein